MYGIRFYKGVKGDTIVNVCDSECLGVAYGVGSANGITFGIEYGSYLVFLSYLLVSMMSNL